MKTKKVATLKTISLDTDKREIIITISAKDSNFIQEPTGYGFPYLVNSAVIANGLPYLLEFGSDAVNAMKGNSDFIELVNNNRQLQADITNSMLAQRVKQFLSSIDYGTLTDFQAKCALLLEQELKKS